MTHANAALTPRRRLIYAQLVVDVRGQPINKVAARWTTVGPTPGATQANRSDATHSTLGCTTTTFTDPTRPAATGRPSRD